MSVEPAMPGEAPEDARVWIEDGILCIEYPANARVGLGMAHATFRRRKAFLAEHGKARHRIMIIGSRILAFDYAAYRFSAGKEVSDTVIAAALVCHSTLERHLSSVFVNMFRPRYPVRIFETREQARTWLETFPEG